MTAAITDDVRDGRIRQEYPGHPDLPALAASLGMPVRVLYARAARLGVARSQEASRKARSEAMARSAANAPLRAWATGQVDEAILASQVLPVRSSPADERRRSRARQLAEHLRAGPVSWWTLKQALWTEQALAAILEDSPEWFAWVLGQVVLTEAGKVEFGEVSPSAKIAYQKKARA